ncbi:MAG TPA: flagellar biosynthetic protein FliO [bacterium]|nr:flagellar biosynthetic protein FliO [bacterium]
MLVLLAQVQTVPPTGETAVDFTWLFIKMLLILGVVSIGAVLVLKYAVPQIGAMKRFQQGRYFTVLGRYPLEPRKSLYLVNIGRRYLVIGASDHAINLVGEISEEEAMKDRDQ